ncbi:hypothetical protein ABZ753_33865 [Streptomyces griseoincarnatus]
MDVTARLGLASADVTLATWPNVHGDWTPVVHPTLLEAIGLHAALTVAIDALHLANRLADGWTNGAPPTPRGAALTGQPGAPQERNREGSGLDRGGQEG